MSDIREGKVETGPNPLPGGPLGQIAPFAFLALAALWTHRQMYSLPARMPIHWNAQGQANGFIPREDIAQPLWIGFAVCVFLALLGMLFRKTAPRGDVQRRVLRILLAVELFTCALASSVVLSAAWGRPLPALIVATVGMVILLGFCIVVSGAGRIPQRNPGSWRGGVIYSDRDDPALFVPRRSGLGYTLNFAHPRAVPALIGLLLLPISAIVIALLMH
jgi:uncharacterized membrane protein